MSYPLAVVLIVAIMAVVFVIAVRSLRSTPTRVAVVITAIIGFIIALPPVIEALKDPSLPTPSGPANPADGTAVQR
ncbi:hypothetical protein HFP70_23000 [Streptomyces sp. ARC14]|uniref:hypothetical protein n=1 Tax=Streptomyces sp. ARC14 TaxID=2724152 RepID=UPI003857B518